MSKVIGQLAIELTFETSKFNQGITKAKRNLKTFEQETRNSVNMAKRNNFAMGDSALALKNLSATYGGYQTALAGVNQKMAELRAAGEEGTVQYERLEREAGRLRQGAALTKDQFHEVRVEALTVNSSLYKLGDGMEVAGEKIQGFGKGVQKVGGYITKAGAVATAGGAMFVKQAMDYEQGMKGIQRVTGRSDEQMNELSDTLRGLATSMNVTHEETQQIAESAARLGIPQQQIGEFTRVIAMMGATTDLSVGEASNAIARFTSITGTGAEGAERLGSTLVHLGSEFATTESEIVSASMQMVGTLSALGASEPQILGIATALGALGISAERGGGSISKFFSELQLAAIEGGDAIAGFAEVAGRDIEDFSNLVQTAPVEAFELFIQGLARIQEEGGNVVDVLDDLGISEVRMRDTILRLAGGHKVLSESIAEANKEYKNGTALQDQYNVMMQSTSAQWQVFKNKIKDVAIELGSAFLPAVNDLLSHSQPMIDKLKGMAEGFSNLSPKMKENIVKWGALSPLIGVATSALGGVISVGGGAVSKFGDLTKGLAGMIAKAQDKSLMGLPEIFLETADGASASTEQVLGMVSATKGGLSTFQSLKVIGTSLFSAKGAMVMGAVAAAGAMVYFGKKAYDAHAEVQKLEKAKVDWGLVSPDDDKIASVERFSESYMDLRANIEMGFDGSNIDGLTDSLGRLGNELDALGEKRLDDLREQLRGLAPEALAIIPDIEQRQRDFIDGAVGRGKDSLQRMGKISQDASEQVEGMTRNQEINMNRHRMILAQSYSDLLGDSVEESQNVFQALNADVANMNGEAVKSYMNSLADIGKKAVESNKLVEEEIGRQVRDGIITQEEGHQVLEVQQDMHEQRMRNIQIGNAKATARDLQENNWLFRDKNMNELLDDQYFMQQALAQHNARMREINAEHEDITMEQFRDFLLSQQEELEYLLDGQIDTVNNKFDAMTHASAENWNDYVTKMTDIYGEAGDSFADVMEKAMNDTDNFERNWNELVLAKKNAPLSVEDEEALMKIMLFEKRWDDMTFDEKIALLGIDHEGEESIRTALDMLNMEWNAFEAEVVRLTADGYPVEESVRWAMFELGEWENLEPEEVRLLVDALLANDTIMETIDKAGLWEEQDFPEKILSAILEAETVFDGFQRIVAEYEELEGLEGVDIQTDAPEAGSTQEKLQNLFKISEMLFQQDLINLLTGTNAPDTTADIQEAQLVANILQRVFGLGADFSTTTSAGDTEGEVSSLEDQTESAQGTMEEGADFDTTTNASETEGEASSLEDQTESTQNTMSEGADLETSTNAPETEGEIKSAGAAADAVDGKVSVIQIITKRITEFIERKLATGTPYHQGGPAILGDGGRHEPFLTPDGYFDVSPNVDTPYDLPRGTRVWPSISSFKADAHRSARLREYLNQIPHFADGTGRSFLDDMRTIRVPQVDASRSQETVNQGDTYNITLDLNVIGSSLTRDQADNIIEPLLESADRLSKRRGGRVNFGTN